MSYRKYYVNYLEFSTYTFITCKQTFIVAIYLFYLIPLARSFSSAQSENGKNGHHCLVRDLKQGECSLSLLSMMLAVEYIYIFSVNKLYQVEKISFFHRLWTQYPRTACYHYIFVSLLTCFFIDKVSNSSPCGSSFGFTWGLSYSCGNMVSGVDVMDDSFRTLRQLLLFPSIHGLRAFPYCLSSGVTGTLHGGSGLSRAENWKPKDFLMYRSGIGASFFLGMDYTTVQTMGGWFIGSHLWRKVTITCYCTFG